MEQSMGVWREYGAAISVLLVVCFDYPLCGVNIPKGL